MKKNLFINKFHLFSTERDVLPPIQLLLPEYPTFRAAPGDAGRHTSLPAGVPAQTWPQTAIGCVSAQTCTEDHKVSAASQGENQPIAYTNTLLIPKV